MADKKPGRDYGHDPEIDEMMAELEAALEADQMKRKAGLEATTVASRQMKEEELLNKVEKASREATQRMQATQPAYPTPVQPGPQGLGAGPGGIPYPTPVQPGPQGPVAMAPPIKAQPMPAGPPAMPLPPQMPPPQPMMAMAPPVQGQPMPTPAPPPPQAPPMPPPQPMMTPEQWAMLQQEVYGA